VGRDPLDAPVSFPGWPLGDLTVSRRRHSQVLPAGGERPHALGPIVRAAQDDEGDGAAADRRLHLRVLAP
jgi:hypothetical protein